MRAAATRELWQKASILQITLPVLFSRDALLVDGGETDLLGIFGGGGVAVIISKGQEQDRLLAGVVGTEYYGCVLLLKRRSLPCYCPLENTTTITGKMSKDPNFPSKAVFISVELKGCLSGTGRAGKSIWF